MILISQKEIRCVTITSIGMSGYSALASWIATAAMDLIIAVLMISLLIVEGSRRVCVYERREINENCIMRWLKYN